jgi:predicted  nucleic acid-binding Zn-ribbon protein
MKIDAKLKGEIAAVQTRLEVLTNRRKQLQQQIPALEAKFLTEDSVGYEPLQQARLELITLDQSIDSIKDHIADLQEQLAASVSITEKEALIVSMRSAGQNAERSVREYGDMVQAASDEVEKIGRALLLKKAEINLARNTFAKMQSEASELGIHDAMIGLSPAELRTVRERKVRHDREGVLHYQQIMVVESAVQARVEKEARRANANTAA